MPMLIVVKTSLPLISSGRVELLVDPFGDVDGVLELADVLEQHRELVSAQPRHRVARTQAVGQSFAPR